MQKFPLIKYMRVHKIHKKSHSKCEHQSKMQDNIRAQHEFS